MRRFATGLYCLLGLAAIHGCGEDKPSEPIPAEAPVIRSVTPAAWSVLSGVVELAVDAPGAATYALTIDGSPAASGITPQLAWDTATVPNGPHQARLVATNNGGSADTTIILVCDNPGRGTAVLLTPRDVIVEPDASYQFEARLLGGVSSGVSWKLVTPGDEPGAWGSITADGRYTAPTERPTPPTVTILAQSLADPSKASTARVRIEGVSVRILGAPASLILGRTVRLSARVGGAANPTVAWSVEDGASHGSITAGGLYTAPMALPDPPNVRIRATVTAHPNRSSLVSIALAEPPPPVLVSVSPAAVSLRVGGNTTFHAGVVNAADTRVTWSVEGGAPFGTITPAGNYQAPNARPSPGVAVIRATSVADPSSSATATVNLLDRVTVSISPTAISLMAGGAQQFRATVTHADDPHVAWAVGGGGTITQTGFYTAPTGFSRDVEVVITATSVEEPTARATARVTVNSLLSEVEAGNVLQLGRVGYQFVQISDQSLGAALSVLALAYRLNGNQLVTTGILRQTPQGYVYEPGTGLTSLTVIRSDEPITLTVQEATGYPQASVDRDRMSHTWFIGTLQCRLQVGTSLDVRIVHSSSEAPYGDVVFNRTVRGSVTYGPIRRFGVTHSGQSYSSSHVSAGRHDIVGGGTLADGVTVLVDEQIDLQYGENCYLPGGRFGRAWYHAYHNSLVAGPDRYVLDGRIGGASEGGCGGSYPRPAPAEFWGATGTVTKNGTGFGELTLSRDPSGDVVPDAILHMNALGLITFRQAGNPVTGSIIASPF